ncbi:hypothetical protein LCGC14_0420180 [marine sediment metagenome]|uniref:Uncharacterized protein n=1 Tax=marine sediment metagenome TaxID=412755 RepID=A0A0F9SX17_9ZZZZ
MPTKDSHARGIRVSDEDYKRIMKRANPKKWTFNRWMNWAISLGLRKHGKEGLSENGNLQ